MQGIMSGMTPVRLKDGGFPDLTGDGKVTQKDILKGRGIEGFADGGDADKSFFKLQRTAEGSGANLRDFTDLVFDPTDPVDYAIAGLMIFPPAAIAAKLIKLGVKGNKLKNKMKKVEVMKDAQRSMGTKAKDLFTTNPIDNMAAANGLVLGGTRTTALGATGQLALRNELADLGTTNERSISRIGNTQLYSKEARDQIREDPSLVKKGGIGEYVEIGSDLYDIAKDPEGRELLAEVIKESLPSMPNVFGTVDDEIINRRDGGIASFKTGGLAKGGKAILKKTKEKIKLKKDGTPDKRSQPKTKTPDKPKSSGTKINEKVAQAKPKQTPAQKKAAAERKRKADLKKAEKKRQDDIDAKAKADAAARRKKDADDFNQSRQQTPATKVDDAAKSSAGKDSKIPEGKVDDLTLGQKTFNALNPNVFNPNTTYKPAKVIGGLYAATRMMDEEDDYEVSDQEPVDSSVGNNLSLDNIFDQDIQGNIPDTNPDEWAQIMKDRIVNDRGIPLDDQGNFTQKPKFIDYLKSLPGAYSDKVQRDPDFAKKMMAGFLNMMKPVEGYVPINSAVAFGEGYLGEETRQADMLPADAKMLKFLQANPDLYDKYLESESAKAGVLLSDAKQQEADRIFNSLLGNLSIKYGVPLDNIGDYKVIYTDPASGRTMEIDSTVLLSMGDQSVKIVGSSNLELVLR